MPLAARTNRGSTFTKRNKMNSKNFLDQLGLIALISKIKQALNGKQDVDMVVTIANSGNAYSCDTSIADIVAAHDAWRDVYAVLPPVSDGSSTKIKLVEVQNYGSGTVMMVSFGGIINNGTNNVLYSVSGTRQNNLDAWSVSQKTLQEKLVSGTSIKTINGNTLLGSGDVSINGSERVTATWNASTSAYVSGTSVDNMYQSFYTDGKVLELHLVNGSYNGMVLTCHGGYTDGSVRHMKFSGVTDDWIVSCDVVGTAVTVTYTSLFDIYEELNGKQDTIGLNNKVDADLVEYRGADTSRLGNGDSMTEALQTLDAAITNLGTPNEIASITTQESSASGGNNVVTITDTDGTSTSFNVKNGIDGQDGADGVSLGEIALVQTTGDATDAVMSQKAVSGRIKRLTEEDLEQSIAFKRLPEGYEMLDYIINGTATGSCAAIDTGLVPDDDDWQFKGSWARNGNIGNYGRIIESYFSEATYCYRLAASGTSVAKIYANAYSRGNSGTVVPLSDSSVDVWHTYDLSHGKLVLDGVENEISTVAESVPSPTTLKIGHVNYPQKTKVFQAYHNGELVAYMVPCKYGSDVGMYDLVREQFYTSSNANTFSAGAVVVVPADRLLDGEHLAGMIEQQTGNSDFKLMSQAAISEQVERLDVDTLDSTTEQLKRIMTKRGWVFGKTLANTGALVDGANYCTSPFLSMENPLSHSITLAKGNTAGQQAVWYDENQVKIYNLTYSANPYTIKLTNASFADAKYVRLSFSIANLRDCYLRDNTELKYIIKMDDYIDEVLRSQSFIIDLNALSAFITNETGEERFKLMSQYGDMVSNYTTKKPTYIQGRLCYYRLADYPQLDPRTADGISIAFAKDEAKAARTPMFDIWPNTAFSTKHFGLWYWDGSVKFGFFSGYGTVTTGGYSFGNVKGHYVLTYNFKTGEVKCYRNGVLYSTQTPASWDEQTMIRDYFESCTHIVVNALKHADRQKMNGIAVFGSVLTDDDVADLYGSGNESIRGVLIQDKWQANALHPIYPNLGVAVRSSGGFSVTKETDGSSTIQWSGSGAYTWLDFGFFGLNGLVLNNATLDWDFEITSGSIAYKGGSYDRTYHGNALGNNYAKDVYTIFDANGNDVTTSDLGIGTYHVTAKPNHVAIGFHDLYDIQNGYVFTGCSEDIAINIKKTVKVAERGAALECSITNYTGAFWKLANGIQLPFHSGAGGTYETSALYVGTDTYIEDTLIYSSSVAPQFNGQLAVDPTAGKVYVGYLTGTGGTWKQINNS